MGMSLMVHMATLTAMLVATLGIIRARNTGKAAWGWVSGISVGVLSLIRPLDGLVVAGLLGLWAIGLGGRRVKIPAIAGLVLGAIAVGALVLPYNKALTGSPTEFPIMVYTDAKFGPGANAYGFGPQRGAGWAIDPFPGHGPIDALINANLNAFSLNIELFGWSTGSLLLVAVMLFRGRHRTRDMLMLAAIAAIFVAYFFNYFSGGPDFGARYWFLMLVPCLALTVSGVRVLEGSVEQASPGSAVQRVRVMVAVLSLCVIALVNYFPWRAIDKYHHYRGMRPDIRNLAKEHGFGRSLVLVRGDAHPDYASAAAYNPLDLSADAPVYAWDRDAETRSRVLRAYAGRTVWVVHGPTLTHAGYEVLAGPLPAGSFSEGGDDGFVATPHVLTDTHGHVE